MDVLKEKYRHLEDWSRTEKIKHYFDLSNDASTELLFPPELMRRLREKNVSSAFDIRKGTKGIGWFTILEVNKKISKNGKPFMRLKITDDQNNTASIMVWGDVGEDIRYTNWLSEIKNDPNWGMSTSLSKMKKIDAFD